MVAASSLELALKKTRDLKVMVTARDHANCDSLPLRYGIFFTKDTLIEIANISYLYVDRQYSDRYHVNATIKDGAGNETTGHFVVSSQIGYEEPILVTVWRHDVDTEFRLSELMISLRRKGIISPDNLLELHPLYVKGKINSAADLLEQLALKLSSERVALMKAEAVEANKRADDALVSLTAAIKRAEHAENIALEATYIVDDLEHQKIGLSNRVGELEAELELYKAEQRVAKNDGKVATLSLPDVLMQVRENEIFNGSKCTILVFQDGSQKHMKISTFDKSGAVTKKALLLIGRRVRTTCWDPIGQVGKWSKQGYFRNIYAIE